MISMLPRAQNVHTVDTYEPYRAYTIYETTGEDFGRVDTRLRCELILSFDGPSRLQNPSGARATRLVGVPSCASI